MREQIFHGLKNTTDILFRRQASITSAATIIIVLALTSRFLGLIRQRILLGEFGDKSPELAAFIAAFKIPDIVFNILVLGALATAFIPVISGYLSKRQDREAWKIFSIVVNFALIITALFTAVVFVFAHPIASFLLGELQKKPEIIDLTANIIRILTVGQFFLIASNFVTGLLNSYHRFLIPALSPVLYNIGIIAGTVLLSGSLGIFGPVVGVLFGAFAHLLIQIPLLIKLGIRYSFILDTSVPGVREVGRLMGPRTLGVAIAAFDPIIDTILSLRITSTPPETNIIILSSAALLQAVPAGVFGFAFGAAALPTLSREFAQEKLENFKSTLIASLHQIFYLVIPAIVVLVVLRIPLVRLAFGAPGVDWETTKLIAYTLAAFSLAIVGHSAIQLLARGFYAIHDTKTPVKISIFSILIGIGSSIYFVYQFNNVVFIAIAASIAGITNAALLLYFLSKRVGGLDWGQVFVAPAKMALAGALAALALYTPLKILDAASYGQLWLQGSIVHTYFGNLAIDTSHTAGLIWVTLISSGLGLVVYFLMTYLLGVEEIAVFAKIFDRIKTFIPLRRIEKAATRGPLNGSDVH